MPKAIQLSKEWGQDSNSDRLALSSCPERAPAQPHPSSGPRYGLLKSYCHEWSLSQFSLLGKTRTSSSPVGTLPGEREALKGGEEQESGEAVKTTRLLI